MNTTLLYKSQPAGIKFKLMTRQASAEAVINIIGQYGLDLTGMFISHNGTVIPW